MSAKPIHQDLVADHGFEAQHWPVKRFVRSLGSNRNPPLKQVTYLEADEICVGWGQRYITLVLDINSGVIVFVGKGKSAAALELFWRRLRASKARGKAVAMDLPAAYRSAVEKNLPKATIVFDHFHLIKLDNEKLTQLRRELHRQATDERQKQFLKGTH